MVDQVGEALLIQYDDVEEHHYYEGEKTRWVHVRRK